LALYNENSTVALDHQHRMYEFEVRAPGARVKMASCICPLAGTIQRAIGRQQRGISNLTPTPSVSLQQTI